MKTCRTRFFSALSAATVFLLCITVAAGAQTGTVESESVPSETTPAGGVQITVDIDIDMSGVNSPDNLLGSFTASLAWDPVVLCYVSHSGVQAGFTGMVNEAGTATGQLLFNGANSSGAGGAFTVLTVTFDVCGTDSNGTDLDLEFSAMAAAATFNSLIPILTITDGHIHITSTVPEGVTAVSIPSDEEPAYCDTIEVDITINMAGMSSPDDKLGSFTASLTWDPSVLCYQRNSGLLAGFSGAINSDNTAAGQLIFNGAKANGAAGETTVFSVDFHACGSDSNSTDLDLEFSAMAAAFTFRNLLPFLTVTDGHVHISQGGQLPGDINGDGANTPADALCVFWRSILADWQPECDFPGAETSGDVNGDGSVTPADALCIFWKAITNIWPEGCLPEPMGKTVIGEEAYTLRIGTAEGKQGDVIRVPIAVDSPSDLDAFGLQLAYPADLLLFQGVSATEATVEWIALEGADTEPGIVSIGGFHIEGLTGTGDVPILEAVFEVREEAAGESAFEVLNLKDDLAGARVTGGHLTVEHLPTQYALSQNYPNPFNPETEIAFSLPEAAQVTLTIHNVLGQAIAEILVDDQMEAGHHTVSWNGANATSGIYFYSIQTNDFSDTKRMVLMK